ncbi:MAG TPA: response regulator [Stellaceae bacterium]|nr:response regulator [Stellaceae bacterium]
MPDGLGPMQRTDAGVLLIDDDFGVAQSFTEVLKLHDIPIAVARDEYEATAAFRWSPPAVVLTDIVVPERRDAAIAMRRARPDLKLVAMSGGRVTKFDFLTIAKKSSADAIVHTPFAATELIKLLRTFLHHRRRLS